MQHLSTDLVCRACRIFLSLAYPEGEGTVPVKRRVYGDLPQDQPLADFLLTSAEARAICQPVKDGAGSLMGCAIRLGCAGFPHLKLKVQKLPNIEPPVWVFGVDTHDAFNLPAGHPDLEAWKNLQEANRQLKEKIERAWEKEGLVTFNAVLRSSLGPPPDGRVE
jgi:hypothetical protein